MRKIILVLMAVTICVSFSSCEIPTENSGGTRAETEESTYITTTTESETTSESTTTEKPETTASSEETEPQTEEETTEESETAVTAERIGIRPEFKEALDAYEEFFDDYCDIMKKYMENPLDMNILTEYYEYIEKAEEMDEKIEALDDGELSDEELAYYLEVTTRVMTKMLEIYQ